MDHGRAIAFYCSTKNLNAKAVEPGFQEMSVAEGDDTLGRSRRKKIEYLQQKVLHWWAMWEGHRFGSPNQSTNNNVNGSIYFRLLRPFVCFPCWTYNQSRCWAVCLFVCKCSLLYMLYVRYAILIIVSVYLGLAYVHVQVHVRHSANRHYAGTLHFRNYSLQKRKPS